MREMKQISLDVFEMGYLLDTCIRGSHLRSDTVRRFVDEWYGLFTEIERIQLFEWTIRLTYDRRWTCGEKDYMPHFEPYKSCCGHDVEFVHRYHPGNQYLVTTTYKGKKEQHHCFRMNGHYHLSSSRILTEEHITAVEHLHCPEWDRWKQPGVDYDRNIIDNSK